jgi:hypothetical protein
MLVVGAGPETTRLALGLVLTTDPVSVDASLLRLESLLAVTVAVSLKGAPLARLLGAETVRVKVSELPKPMLVAVPVTVPPDGGEKLKLSGLPGAGVMET